jgi:hypothetical protein
MHQLTYIPLQEGSPTPGARLTRRRRVRELVRAFDGGCAIQNGYCLQLLYLHTVASSPHLPLPPLPPACSRCSCALARLPSGHSPYPLPNSRRPLLPSPATPRILLATWIASAPAPATLAHQPYTQPPRMAGISSNLSPVLL